jgi:hypothetical protein
MDFGNPPPNKCMKRSVFAVFIMSAILAGNAVLHSQERQGEGIRILKERGPYLGQKQPGERPELFAPGIVSNCTQHSSACFTPDGRAVYFSRMLPQPSVIMVMEEAKDGWTSPQEWVKGLTPGLSPDGRVLYFSRDWALWKMVKSGTGWSKPEKLGPVVNFQKRQDGPSVTRNGVIYFCSMYGDMDGIYRAFPEKGAFIKREKLGSGINRGPVDGMPYIAPDESFLIFASFRRGGYGMSDLYITFRGEDGQWTNPVNMGPQINSPYKDGYPWVTPDGRFFFFNSSRPTILNERPVPDGPGNVFWVDGAVISKMREAVFRRQ